MRVVPTRNLPQGISALLAFDPAASLDENAERMLAAIATVRAVEVTHAVRDTSVNGHDIKVGDVIAVVDDEITEVGNDYLGVIDAVLRSEPRTPRAGHGVPRRRGQRRRTRTRSSSTLRGTHPDTEFEIQTGGQEHYPYVLSLE